MRKFIRSGHVLEEINVCLIGILFLIISVGEIIIGDHSIQRAIFKVFGIILFTTISIYFVRKSGLYLQNDLLSFRIFRTKHFSPADIAVIKIAPAYRRGGKYLKDSPIKGDDGQQLYTMIFLKEFIPWRMKEEQLKDIHGKEFNDIQFRYSFSDCLLAYAKYDQSVIDYLLTLNPNIIVF